MPATASAIISVRSDVHSSGTGLILQLLQGKSAFTLPVLRVISRFQNLLVVRYTVASIRDSKRACDVRGRLMRLLLDGVARFGPT